ncbi:MAG: glycosyltransferase family 4 protein [Thermoleophilia bacterium]
MRLAYDARMATWGGVGTYTRELLAALSRDHESLGIRHILAFRAPEDVFLQEVDHAGIIEWRSAPGSPWSPAANARLGLAARGGADVFHATHFPVPVGFGGPLVTTIHDLIPLLAPESMPYARRRAAFSGMVRWAISQSDVVICVTRAAAQEIIRRFADDTHYRVIHHGLGIASTDDDTSSETLLRHRLKPGYVLWVGTFKPHKDVPTLLAAHRRLPPELRERHPLVLAGDDQMKEGRALRADLAASSEEEGRRVYVLGRVPPHELPGLYQAAGVFAFPSRIEGFGLPPLEAMAHNVPVVSSRAAPMPEVLGDAAAYFTPGDSSELAICLTEVLSDPKVAAALRARGAKRVCRYSWERTARETAAAYRLAFTSRTGSPLSSIR